MENLNAEQIIDILDKMDFFEGQRAGRELWNAKPFEVQEQDIANFSTGVAFIKKYITSQEQRIKELTDELTRKETEYNELYELLQTYKADSEAYRSYSKTLEKENEALKTLLNESYDTQNALTEENERLMRDKTALECVVSTARNQAKADTVRKYAEKVYQLIFGFVGEKLSEQDKDYIMLRLGQIAKEMLEGEE